jgi:uncharacterized circularly permuted ATP-grasp superfamily protein
MNFEGYETGGYYDELFDATGAPRSGAALLVERVEGLPPGDLARRQEAAEAALMNSGITFAVYGNEQGAEKIWPFDIIPASSSPPTGITSAPVSSSAFAR